MKSSLETAVLQYIEEHVKSRSYPVGQVIFAQGEPADGLFYMKSGLAHVYTLTEDGGERNILTAYPGRFFGAATFINGGLRQSSAIAVKKCEVLKINRQTYQDCVEQHPKFQQILLEELSADLIVMFEQLTDSSLLAADIKVARFICRRLEIDQEEETKGVLQVLYTQDLIANVLGLSRWSVNRSLSAFKSRGWVKIGRGKILVIQAEALHKFAYSCKGM